MNSDAKPGDVIRLAIPNKGRIADPIIETVEKSGLRIKNSVQRKLISRTSDPEIEVLFARPIDIPEFVADGAADLGITGKDMIMERGSDVEELLDLQSGNANLVLAVPADSDINDPKQLDGLRVATEFSGISKKYFNGLGIDVTLVPVGGACEAAPYLGIADAIIDLTSSGVTLATNNLRVVDEVLRSTTVLIANRDAKERHPEKIAELCLALESVIMARGQCYLMMNVTRPSLEEVKRELPGLSGPTVMDVSSDDNLVAVHAVVKEDHLYSLVGKLKKAGARDILVIPIERMIR
ncbi:ATP phosphoribosyltransferase [Methanolacinia petrolearia DSM 11571]|uniref:ATP phosphoribosyltransferase n=1 Tax=Methanolacinia petrolearia (strain DSM 11571 / OCM 486 / SEBR 4847) TaxID=679926 RepID=E1RKS3_METP4|nr:ATP phosphoribosyltransferase [Methanolacinia petrolearia]ADN37012.1 ATP phosphoribosyltransferase [Methanolacinia petrolearia DSM 11571]